MQIARPAIVLFIVTFVAAAALGIVNMLTHPVIEANSQSIRSAAMAELLPEAKDNSFSEDIPVEIDGSSVVMYNIGYDGADIAGYIVTSAPKGYGGEIWIMTAVSPDCVVKGVKITDIAETPGLGTNAEKPEFLNQFNGKSQSLTVVKTKAGENEIEAITSATITSRAVTKGVSDAIEFVRNIESGGASN